LRAEQGILELGFQAIMMGNLFKKQQRHARQVGNSQALIGQRLVVHDDAPERVFVFDLYDVHG
jgi:hypothetical protein